MSKRSVTQIYFDERVNRFRGNDGKYVSRKDLQFDFLLEKYRYKGKFVTVKGLQYDKKTGDFKNTLGNTEKIKTQGPKPLLYKARTLHYNINDMFKIKQLSPYTLELQPKNRDELLNYMKSLLTSFKLTTHKAVYLYCEGSIGPHEFKFSSFMVKNHERTEKLNRMIDDFIEKFDNIINGLLTSKEIAIANIRNLKYNITLVYKDWG